MKVEEGFSGDLPNIIQWRKLCNQRARVVKWALEKCKGVRWRCLLLSDSNLKEIVISLPQHLLNEVDGIIRQENVNRDELIHQATKMYLRERKKRHIRESMRQGYMEMAKINLNIASEAFLAEEEAENTLDRLVSGV